MARQFEILNVFSSLFHPNVVNMLGLCVSADTLAVVMEYMPLGSLETLLQLPTASEVPKFVRISLMLYSGRTSKLQCFRRFSFIGTFSFDFALIFAADLIICTHAMSFTEM